MDVNIYSTKDYENKRRRGPQKNKPKQTQFQTGLCFCKDIYWLPEHILSRNSSLAGGGTELFNLMSAILFGLWLERQYFHRSHRIRCYSPARASNDENPPLIV